MGIIPLLIAIFLGLSFGATPEDRILQELSKLREDMTELKASQRIFMEQVDKRLRELREDMNKRFEQVDKRFEQVNNELDRLVNIMVGVFAGQIALVAAVIGFAWWDRKTVIREAREETIEELEQRGSIRKLIEVLREKAKHDKELAEILKSHGLL
ncbi:MAG: hypothetical protein GXO18_03975 [Aquificae bacterium]|nr:hypothetical protein [Aquificota bacterium]